MSCGELVGDDFELLWDTESPYDFDDPTWVAQDSVGDIELNVGKVAVEIPKRTASKTRQGGRQEWSLSFTMNYSRSNDFHQAVMRAIESGDPIHIGLCDGEYGEDAENLWHAVWHLTGPLGASIDEGATVEVDGMPHTCAVDGDEDPVRDELSGGT